MTDPKVQPNQQDDSGFESYDSDSEISITQQVEDAIRELPTLQQKIQAIAINGYMLQKKQLDEKLDEEKRKIEYKTRNTYNADIDEVYGIIEATTSITKQDYEFIQSHKQLFTQAELQQFDKIVKGEQKLSGQQAEINQFWLKCMKNSEIISEQVHPNDEQVLKNLYRIEAWRNEDNTKLIVSFLFKPNKWFNNEKISKNFNLNKKGQVQKSYGDQIDWKQGMNYIVSIVKSKGKKKGQRVTKQKTVKQPSFFHFFQAISSNSQENHQKLDEDAWEDLMEDLQIQHEVSQHIYEDLIPKSLQYYLGCNTDQKHVGCECHGQTKTDKKQSLPIDEESDEED